MLEVQITTLFVRFEHRAWRKTPLKPKIFKHSIGRFAPPVQAGKHASRSANQIEAPCPAGTISAPPLGGRFPVRAPKILFSGLSPLDLALSGVLEIHAHTFPGFPLFHGYSPLLYTKNAQCLAKKPKMPIACGTHKRPEISWANGADDRGHTLHGHKSDPTNGELSECLLSARSREAHKTTQTRTQSTPTGL